MLDVRSQVIHTRFSRMAAASVALILVMLVALTPAETPGSFAPFRGSDPPTVHTIDSFTAHRLLVDQAAPVGSTGG